MKLLNKTLGVGIMLLIALPATATNSLWDGIMRQVMKNSKSIKLSAVKGTPKSISFRGVISIPSYLSLNSGSGTVNAAAGQIIIDGQMICNYSPSSSYQGTSRFYYLKSCSDYSRAGDDVSVASKIEVRLNYSSATTSLLSARIKVKRSDVVQYGLDFPYVEGTEGQILMHNGEAWVAANPEDLDIEGLQGEDGEQGLPGPQGPAGSQGPQGPQGPAGANGAAGVKGDKGDAGAAGAVGPQGPAGAIGPQGPAGTVGAAGAQGPKGDSGAAGPQGSAGAAGAIGPQGPAGAVGAAGAQGPKGDSGAIGPQGPAGAVGAAGAQGPKGDSGAIGPQGPAGAVGAAGAIGPQGPAGAVGAAGAIGPQGPAGAVGAAGAIGPQGPAGAVGAAGAQGPKGDAGAVGSQGPAGATGAIGPQGLPGLPGATGATGSAGAAGAKGDKGDKGDRGLSEIAYLRDEKPSGTNGGSCVVNVWNTRSLNVLGGDIGFISLSNNRFVLQPGTYFIEITAPAMGVTSHQAKLKVIETNADVMYGSTSYAHATASNYNHSTISGEIIVSQASTFEVQHRCAKDTPNVGFGFPASFGTVEIYTQVKIIKKQ